MKDQQGERPKHLMFITDAWQPQVNGVVRTLESVKQELEKRGWKVSVVYPDRSSYVSFPCPTYPEILLSFDFRSHIRQRILELKPDCIHIATEGPLGLAARLSCRKHKIPFTTSLHTRFPEYVYSRIGFAKSLTYSYMRWFHSGARRTLVTNQEMNNELSAAGFKNLVTW
jgi:glycosyltransferase involved in cell wall biosynthesis